MNTGEWTVADAPRFWPPDEAAIATRGRAAAALGVLLCAGLLIDLTMRVGPVGIGTPLVVVTTVGAVLMATAAVTRTALLCFALAVLFATGAAFRASGWLVALDVIVALALCALGAGYRERGRVGDLPLVEAGRRLGRAAGAVMLAPDRVGRLAVRVARPHGTWDRTMWGRILFGAVPALVIVGGLLAWADPVLASWFRSFGGGDTAGHLALTIVGAVLVGAVVVTALQRPVAPSAPRAARVRTPEAATTLAGLVLLFAAFLASQGAGLLGGAGYVRRTTGLTYAEYARAGFFQLVLASGVTAVVLLAVRAAVRAASARHRRWLVVLGVVAVALTLGAVVVAVHRLALYEAAYGWTLSRLLAVMMSLWLAATLAIVAVSFSGIGSGRAWLVPALAATTLVWLGGLNVLNPEGFVVSHNAERVVAGGDTGLIETVIRSDDGIPALAAVIDRLPAPAAALATGLVCAEPPRRGSFLGWNRAESRADASRRRVCRTPR